MALAKSKNKLHNKLASQIILFTSNIIRSIYQLLIKKGLFKVQIEAISDIFKPKMCKLKQYSDGLCRNLEETLES